MRRVKLPLRPPNQATDPVSAYAYRVAKGGILAGRLVRLAAERHLDDLQNGERRGLVWSVAHAKWAISFISAYCRHSKGEWAGQSLLLEPWQKFLIGSMFGWLRADGTRRFRTVYAEIGRKNGKALAIDTPVATPDGWRRHGDLRPGDMVFDPFGRPAPVLGVTQHYDGPCRTLRFSDGTEIVAHDRHEWRTMRRAHMIETADIARTLRHGGRGDLTHAVETCCPLILPDAVLPVAPYTLGAWLGDGNSLSAMLTFADPEIAEAIAAEGVPIREVGAAVPLVVRLRRLGVLGNKHIPMPYQRASIAQRRELLAGLIDTDGHVTPRGQCELTLTNWRLFASALELARGLGLKPTWTESRARLGGRDVGPRYRMQFWPASDELPLRVPRKRDWLRRCAGKRSRRRMIASAEDSGLQTVNCIEVAGGMYLAGEAMIPTHNSQLASAIGLYLLIADGEAGGEVYSAATKRDQAKIVFNEAVRMARASPELAPYLSIFRNNISLDATGSKFEPLSSDDRTLDGLSPHGLLIDELHRHRTRGVLDVLDTALGARRQPIVVIITTAGDDSTETVYAQERAYAESVIEGTANDDSYLALIYTLDKGDAWDDPRVWIKANPNLGVSVKLDDMRRQALKASRSPAAKVAFKRLRLNIRTSDANREIDMSVWARNTLGPFDPAELQGRRFFGGLDLSSKVDISAFIKLFPPEGQGERWHVVSRFWIPQDTIAERSDRDRVQYQRWVDEGWIETTAGNIIDHNEIEQAVREDCRLHIPISVAYDPWNAVQLAARLYDGAIPVVEFIQGIRSYTAPTKELEAMLAAEMLDHGGNPVLAWMAGNLHSQQDKNLNRMPSKKASIGRIDGMCALIMAIGRSMSEDKRSYLEAEDPIVF